MTSHSTAVHSGHIGYSLFRAHRLMTSHSTRRRLLAHDSAIGGAVFLCDEANGPEPVEGPQIFYLIKLLEEVLPVSDFLPWLQARVTEELPPLRRKEEGRNSNWMMAVS